MNNCLVTKLKEEVNDNTLRRLNSFVCTLKQPASGYFEANIIDGERIYFTKISGDAQLNAYGYVTGNGTLRTSSVLPGASAGDTCVAEVSNAHVINQLGAGYVYDVCDVYQFRTDKTSIKAYSESGISGNIEGLFRLTSLTSLNVNSTLCTGDIKTLAEKMVTAGRTSGNLSIYCNGGGVKSNGTVVSAKKIVFDSSVNGGYTLTNV